MARREQRIARRSLLGGAAAVAGAVLLPQRASAGGAANRRSTVGRSGMVRPAADVPPSTAPLQIYLLATPARLYDSRPGYAPDGDADVAFTPGEVRTIDVSYLLGDTEQPTGVPTTSDGVMVNVTITGTIGAGHVKVWAAEGTEPPTSVLNWDRSGATIANGLTCMHSAGQIKVKASGAAGSSTHMVIDATGFLAVP